MPFVNGTNHPYEIIRRPPAGEDPDSALGDSREYNMAQIHVLLSDDPNEFPGGAQSTDVRLANITTTQATATGATHTNDYGITMTAGNYPSTFAGRHLSAILRRRLERDSIRRRGVWFRHCFPQRHRHPGLACRADGVVWQCKEHESHTTGAPANGQLGGPGAPIVSGSSASAAPTLTLCPPAGSRQYTKPAGCPATPASPYYAGEQRGPRDHLAGLQSAETATWNLIDGYLRVEYKDASGNWNPVTTEWLNLGFARGMTPPTAPGEVPCGRG